MEDQDCRQAGSVLGLLWNEAVVKAAVFEPHKALANTNVMLKPLSYLSPFQKIELSVLHLVFVITNKKVNFRLIQPQNTTTI